MPKRCGPGSVSSLLSIETANVLFFDGYVKFSGLKIFCVCVPALRAIRLLSTLNMCLFNAPVSVAIFRVVRLLFFVFICFFFRSYSHRFARGSSLIQEAKKKNLKKKMFSSSFGSKSFILLFIYCFVSFISFRTAYERKKSTQRNGSIFNIVETPTNT